MFTESIYGLINFFISWKTLIGIIIGIVSVWLYSYFSSRSDSDLATLEKKFKDYQSVKAALNEMLDTLFSPESVKRTVAAKVKDSISSDIFSGKDDQPIVNDILEAHSKYLAFGETISKTPYSNKEIINDYHNFVYKIISEIDRSSKSLNT